MNIKYLMIIISIAIFTLVGMASSVQAEDTEIFFTDSNQTAPNVLFMLDTSGSMSEMIGDKTRMQILKDSLNGVLSRDYNALNVGIMDFNRNRGGGIDFPVADINADAHEIDADIPEGEFTVGRLLGKSFIKNYTPNTFTPMGDAFYRASSYFRGDEILYYADGWGKPHKWNPNKKKYEGGHVYSDHLASFEGANWGVKGTREICTNECVVDKQTECRGEGAGQECKEVCDQFERVCSGTETDEGFDGIPKYISPIVNQCQKNHIVLLSDGEPTSVQTRDEIAERVKPVLMGGECRNLTEYGDDVSKYGHCVPELTKYMSTVDQSPTLVGDQTIKTYTVGFAIEGNEKLQGFLKLLSDEDHGQGGYFDANSAEELVDVFQEIINKAIDDDLSFVAPTVSIDMDNRLTTSEYVYMSTFIPKDSPSWKGDIKRYRVDGDGFDKKGGVLSFSDQLTNSRAIYTYIGNSKELTDASNRVIKNNDDLTSQLLGSSDDERDAIIDWARGVDSSGKALKHMGDSLHTKPAIVYYKEEEKNILYATTNDGFLHAFDISNTDENPREIFAFIPQELLSNLKILKNNVSSKKKVYGLDGGMTVWKNKESGEVTLYFGMRRGGNNYYALDVTDPNNPKKKWTIKGGVGDFTELGQSWSTPQLVNVNVEHDDDVKMALIFGGGYDTNQDDTSKLERSDDSIGRAVFIVDAESGDLLWSVNNQMPGFSELKNSIPSNIRAVDLNSNGLADRLYFGDTGGRAWRIDLDESDITKSTGYQLADFNDGTAAGNRRFYYAPSVAYSRDRKLMIAIGSGYRAHPLATGVQNRFYTIEDAHAELGAPLSIPDAINESNMKNITNADVTNSEATVGWYFNLSENEKVLAESLIFNSNVSFTTYTPNFGNSGNNTCSLAGATAKAYVVRLRDGASQIDTDDDGIYEPFISLTEIKSIPGSPYVVFNKPGDTEGSPAVIYVEKQKIGEVKHITERLFWRKDK